MFRLKVLFVAVVIIIIIIIIIVIIITVIIIVITVVTACGNFLYGFVLLLSLVSFFTILSPLICD